MPNTTPTTEPFRYIDGDDFCLSARLLPDLNAGGTTDTLSITIEGSDEPQSAHVPVGDLPKVLAGIAEAAGLTPARQVLGTTDQQPERVCSLPDFMACGCNHIDGCQHPVTTDQQPATAPASTELRDRIAQALSDEDVHSCQMQCAVDYRALADAVLAVLPAPTNPAAVLNERADFLEGCLRDAADPGSDPRYWTAVRDVAMGLRRMADEAQQPETEAWEPQTEWIGEVLEDDAWMYLGASPDRGVAEKRRASITRRHPDARTRTVRKVTTYTVAAEQPTTEQPR